MKRKSKKTVVFGGLLMAILVILDQVTKFLAASMLKGHSAVELIPGVFELRYLENQSAAFGVDIVSILQKVFHFSYFEEHPEAFLSCKMALFSVFTIIVIVLLMMLYVRVPEANKRFYYMDAIILCFTAGAIGNCIDRVVHNYVIDFFYFRLINFPIFNVADIYVTVSAFFLIVLGLFYYKEEDFELIFPSKEKKEHNI